MRVFVLYAHQNEEKDAQVLALANELRKAGFDAHIDQYQYPKKTWARWSLDEVERAEAIVVVCSPALVERLSGASEAQIGKGARWEGELLIQKLYDSLEWDAVVPVVIDDSPRTEVVPLPLRGIHCFSLWPDLQKLFGRLRGETPVVVPPVGNAVANQGRPFAIPGWAPVSFDRQRDLRPALRGEGLGPRDVGCCPVLDEAKQLLSTLGQRDLAALVGPPGSGKSLTLFQVAASLHEKGWSVMRLVDSGTGLALAARCQEYTGQKLLVVDDANFLHPPGIQALADLAASDTKILLAATESLPGRFIPVTVDSRRAVATLAAAFKERTEEILPLVKEIDPNVGDRWLDTPIERLLEDASRCDQPWQFMFVLGRGERRVATALDSLVSSNRADILLIAIALAHLASLERGVTSRWLEDVATMVGRDSGWVHEAVRNISKQQMLRRSGDRYLATHGRVAIAVLGRHLPKVSREDRWVDTLLRRILTDVSFPLRGRAWLLKEVVIARQWLLAPVLDEATRTTLWGEILSAETDEERASATWMISALAYPHDDSDTIARLASAPVWLVTWITEACRASAYPLADVFNVLINRDRPAAQLLAQQVDPTGLAHRISQAVRDDLHALCRLADRLCVAASEEWVREFVDGINIDSLLPALRAWPSSCLWELRDLLKLLLWRDVKKAAAALDALREPLRKGFSEDPIATWNQFSDVVELGMGFSPLLRDQHPSPEVLETASLVAAQVDPAALGRAISRSRPKDWNQLARFSQWLRKVAANLAAATAQFVDLDSLLVVAAPLWAESAHELYSLIAALALDAKYEPAQTLICRSKERLVAVTGLVAAIAPDIAVELVRAGRPAVWRLRGALPDWDGAHLLLHHLWSQEPALAETCILAAASDIADGMLLRQNNSGDGCADFLDTIERHFPDAMVAVCANIDHVAARTTWLARIDGGVRIVAALRAVLMVVANREGPARELAQEVLATLEVHGQVQIES